MYGREFLGYIFVNRSEHLSRTQNDSGRISDHISLQIERDSQNHQIKFVFARERRGCIYASPTYTHSIIFISIYNMLNVTFQIDN